MVKDRILMSSFFLVFFVLALMVGCGQKTGRNKKSKSEGFHIVEATITDIREAYQKGELTSRELMETYLKRIKKYDQPKKLNSIIVINPNALKRADELDEEFKQTGRLRPLHGIPVIVKDNYETHDLQTTAGSEVLKGFLPPDDAFQVRKLREAGAIVLAKSNMAEWAFSPYETVSSIGGVTRNPYDLSRVPAGSSGGTAASVAANLGVVGLGTDTGNSIRGPASHCCLVGIRSTMGLTSRDGIIPLYLRNDIGGPLTRTVEDAVRILEVIAGYDSADSITEMCRGKLPDNYLQFLDKTGLQGVKIGVFRFYTDRPKADPEVIAIFEKALDDMQLQGAEIIDPFVIEDFGRLSRSLWCDMFRHDINLYFASLGENAPVKSLLDVYNSGLFSIKIKKRLYKALEVPLQEEPACKDIYHEPRNIAFREAVLKAMEEQKVDVIVYPTWNNPPTRLGDYKSTAGDNSQLIPPHTGLPAFNVPMGFTYKNLPAGLQIVGKLFGEPDLIRIAYAYEQATMHRQPPRKFK